MPDQHLSRRRLIAGGAGAGIVGAAAITSSGPASASSHNNGGVQSLFDPIRLYDSRQPDSLLGGDKHRDGDIVSVITGAPDVDFLETVFINVTITQTEGAGFLAVRAAPAQDGVPAPTTSTINWTSPGVTIANAAMSGVGRHQSIDVHCTGEGAATHVIVDLQGYVPFIFEE
jgi:hypothetical protein